MPRLAFREFQASRSIAELPLQRWGWGIVLAWEFIQHLGLSQVMQAVLAYPGVVGALNSYFLYSTGFFCYPVFWKIAKRLCFKTLMDDTAF